MCDSKRGRQRQHKQQVQQLLTTADRFKRYMGEKRSDGEMKAWSLPKYGHASIVTWPTNEHVNIAGNES